MTTRKPRPVIPVAMLQDAAMAHRSSLFLWMWENFETFSAVLKQAGRPDWKSLARTFADQGLTMQGGHPPSPVGSRQTWWKVRKAMAKGSAPTKAVSPATSATGAPAKSTPQQAYRDIAPVTDDEDDGLPKIVLRNVTRQE